MNNRRQLLAAGFALTPLAALLAACGPKGHWPEGMQPIKWDRDPCVHCGMIISDRRFAAEIGHPQAKTGFKFDDIGCALNWLREKAPQHPWSASPATPIWVADSASQGNDVAWLDARTARYIHKTSPMGYNYAAVAGAPSGAEDFQTMRMKIEKAFPVQALPHKS
jgi:hypothetical protein